MAENKEANTNISRFKSFIKKCNSFAKSFGFSFAVSWNASKGYLILRIILEIVTAFLPIITIFFGKEVINTLVSFIGSDNYSENVIRLLKILSIMLSLQISGSIIRQISSYYTGIHKDLISNYINMQIADKTSTLDMSFFDSPKYYNELANAKSDSQALQTLTWFTVDIVRAAIQLFTAAAILARLHPLFPFLIIILNIPSAIIEKIFTLRLYYWSRNRANKQREMGYLMSIITGGEVYAKDIRVYGIHKTILDKYRGLWEEWFGEKRGLNRQRSICATVASIVPQLGIIITTFYLGIKIVYGKFTLGDYSLYTNITSQLTGSVSSLISSITQIYDNDIKLSNYRKFLSWEPCIIPCGSKVPSQMPCIEFKDVSFKYPGTDRYVLDKVSFSINCGEKVAIVGLNGAGKSTIIKLMLRFYDPTEGIILIDGIDIKEYDTMALRKVFSTLFQNYANYAFTARDSITISDISSSEDESRIMDSCHMSGLDELVGKWDNGLNTYLTRQFYDEGVQLSGGEWQKVAITRAFFRDAGIIILDEPSASLDPESEHRVFKQFSELCKGKGAIFISHRLSNTTIADKIIVIEGGKVIEMGTHKELISKAGRYAFLFNLQAEKYAVS